MAKSLYHKELSLFYLIFYTDSGDIETNEDYWISGIKTNGQDRHWAGSGKIFIDRKIIQDYLELVDFEQLDKNKFEPVDILPTDKQRFVKLENEGSI